MDLEDGLGVFGTIMLFVGLAALLFIAAMLLPIMLGGREFDEVVVTKHFEDAHQDAASLKLQAVDPCSNWEWYETHKGSCAVYTDPEKSSRKLLIFFDTLGVGGKLVIFLITGYIVIGKLRSWITDDH